MNETVDDGQHRHAARYTQVMLCIEAEGVKLLARHYAKSKQCRPDRPDAQCPFTLAVDNNNETLAMLICDVCYKELGKCKVSKI